MIFIRAGINRRFPWSRFGKEPEGEFEFSIINGVSTVRVEGDRHAIRFKRDTFNKFIGQVPLHPLKLIVRRKGEEEVFKEIELNLK